MPASDRAAYAERQARLLEALVRGDGYPPGFAVARADAAGRSLRRKRARAVAHVWPALALELGDEFEARFEEFVRGGAGASGADALRDGLAFARSLSRQGRLGDDARAELALARAASSRRAVFVHLTFLRRPYSRLLFVARLPWLGPIGRSWPVTYGAWRRSSG